METKELRKQITRELKEIGMKRQDYSLKIREANYGDIYIKCEIKNPHINIVSVENILMKYREVEYDNNGCGDILQGCNTYVDVKYEYGCFDEASREYEELASQKLQELSRGNVVKAFENNRWVCYLINDGRNTLVKVNDLGDKVISSAKELAILMFRMNEFQEDFI